MVEKLFVNDRYFTNLAFVVYGKVVEDDYRPTKVIGVLRGGDVPGRYLAEKLNAKYETVRVSFYEGEEKRKCPFVNLDPSVFEPNDVVLIVDDLVDTGSTMETLTTWMDKLKVSYKIAVLFSKPYSTVKPDYYAERTDKWVVFPWEEE